MRTSFTKTLLGLSLSAIVGFQSAQAGEPVSGDDWLHVEGNKILDMQGNEVWLTGVNWFGFNAGERTFHGLWSVNLDSTMESMADRGINLLRVPISTELLLEWKNGIYKTVSVNTSTNPDLIGKNSLEVFDASIASAKKHGIKILLDVHSAEADNSGHYAPLWYKNAITSADFYSTWAWVAERYANDDTILAFDLENEPHGQPWGAGDFAKWDNSTDENNWKYACEEAANRVLDKNPNMLVMCEGIESFPIDGVTWTSGDEKQYHNNWWGGNLRGVRDYPIDLGARQSQFMYSPHDYGPKVFLQPWFYDGFNKDTLYNDVWKDNWMFIHEENIAPLLIGEWGGFMDGGANEQWMVAIRDLIVEHKLHHTFWCLNPNSGDTGGLLDHDWTTWDEAKYALFKPSLWSDGSKFIGLDHQVTLGSSGTNVAQYYGATQPSVSITSPSANDQTVVGSDQVISYSLNKAAGVKVYINGQLHTSSASSSQVVIAVPVVEGLFTVKVVAVDSAGQELAVSDGIVLDAVTDIQLDPQISISSPSVGSSTTVNADIPVEVVLKDAAGFGTTLNGVESSFTGNVGSVSAPAVAGDYLLTVTAQDQFGTGLGITDTVIVSVMDVPVSAVTCVVGAADTWGTGFVINSVAVTNTGDASISGWEVELTFNKPFAFDNGWGGQFVDGGQILTVSNVEYNGALASGESASFGLQGGITDGFEAPTCVVK